MSADDSESAFSRKMAEYRAPLLVRYCDGIVSIPLPVNVVEAQFTIKLKYDDGFSAVIEATANTELSVARRPWWQWWRQ